MLLISILKYKLAITVVDNELEINGRFAQAYFKKIIYPILVWRKGNWYKKLAAAFGEQHRIVGYAALIAYA